MIWSILKRVEFEKLPSAFFTTKAKAFVRIVALFREAKANSVVMILTSQATRMSAAHCVTTHRAAKQYSRTVYYPLYCFSLGPLAGPPGKSDYLENFHPGSPASHIGIPANPAGSVVI